ncbi:MAG: hypothetical protein ANIMEMIM_00020 [Candidatus Argoarchaeum ethanivorans]|uniref:Glycosyltransferase RgtA/B/C/D-like domain-containing protein n=1 Tax=Candidatus Argoarchaeum ethanivorans TaxID=2608793 RepID=A0A811T4G1_9EURY|nr:MAG: hypothetical protein ANIMEMIM_00020 [Candidatus Argoarchaeum ethanivorans]
MKNGVFVLNSARVTKIFAIIGFSCIASALYIIAITPPATGYEISIYDAYPSYFWLFLIAAIACGIIILVRQAFAEKPSRWWIAGFSVIFFTNLVILLLPFFRGYVTFARTRGDELTHIGYIMDILLTGHFVSAGAAGANHYPIIHILGANLSLVTGLTPELLAELFPGFFTLFYMFSIYLLSTVIASYRGQALLITAFGSLLLFKHENLMLAPAVACFYMLPFTLFLLCKARTSANRLSYSLLFILILLLTPFLHPGDGTIFLILIFICISFSLWCYLRIKKPLGKAGSSCFVPQSISSINPSLILVVIWFTWFSVHSAFAGTVRTTWNWLVYQIGTTTAMEFADILAKAELSLPELVELVLKMWGHAVIYCLVAAVISVLVWKRFLSPRGRIDAWQFSFSCLFIVFGVLLFIAFFSRAIWVDYCREMRYVIFAATILNGLCLYSLFHNWHRKIGIFIISLLLIASATIGVFNTFPSPIVVEANSQITEMEMTGMGWFFEYRSESLLIDDRGVPQIRFWAALHGVATPHPNIRCYPPDSPPDHFGYLENVAYGESYTEDRYYVDCKLSRIIYPEMAPEYKSLWKITPEDFYRLDNDDSSVSKLYSNGELWVYYVHGSVTISP